MSDRHEVFRIHCLTNPVSMRDVANVLLAAGGSAIMGQYEEEAEEITSLCHATLLNTGVPDPGKFRVCTMAGKTANELGHPLVLDPVGAGASRYRQKALKAMLREIRPSLIRCNQEEAYALLNLEREGSGGVESSVELEGTKLLKLAADLGTACGCTVLISGETDAVSDGNRSTLVTGGDPRIRRLTGSGCMLSALCALFCAKGLKPYEAACMAGRIWKKSAETAGRRTDRLHGGIGSFSVHLFDALDEICRRKEEDII